MFFFFSSRRRHTRFDCDWSSDVCSSDLLADPRELGIIVAPARLAPAAVAVLPPLEPAYGPLDVLMAQVLADRAEPTEDGPGAVDVVHTPASVPWPVVPLRVAEEVERALRRLELSVVAERAEELEAASRQVLRRGIEQRAVVGERDVVKVEALVIRVERPPAAVLPLHAEEPAEAALLREPRRIGVDPV